MSPENQFDAWADTYDDIIEQNPTGYPFEGYHETLRFIQSRIQVLSSDTRILDLGIGTGLLSRPLHDNGAKIYGVDSSPKMLNTARKHMPSGHFHEGNIADDITGMLGDITFHYIISSYAFHHFVDEEKARILGSLVPILEENGRMVIADISFESASNLKQCRGKYSEDWDDEEHYFTAHTMIARLAEKGLIAEYHRTSVCAGVLEIYVKPK